MIIDFLRQLNSYFAHSPHSACAKAREHQQRDRRWWWWRWCCVVVKIFWLDSMLLFCWFCVRQERIVPECGGLWRTTTNIRARTSGRIYDISLDREWDMSTKTNFISNCNLSLLYIIEEIWASFVEFIYTNSFVSCVRIYLWEQQEFKI